MREVDRIGYVANIDIVGGWISIVATGARYDAGTIDNFIEEFCVGYMKKVVANVSVYSLQFKQTKLALAEKAEGLPTDVIDYYDEVKGQSYMFDRTQQYTNILGKLVFADVQSFISDNLVNPSTRRRISVEVNGANIRAPNTSIATSKLNFTRIVNATKRIPGYSFFHSETKGRYSDTM